MAVEQMPFDEWLEYGITNKWCTRVVCSTHDGIPMTDAEETEFDEGSDPCVYATRMCRDKDEFDSVVANNRFVQ